MMSNSSQFLSQNYNFTFGKHQNKNVIWIDFSYNKQSVDYLKANTKAYWSSTQKKWYVTDNTYYRSLFQLNQNTIGKRALSQIHPINQNALQTYIDQLKLKGYSPNTIRCYTTEFAQLLKIIKSNPVNQLSTDKLRGYFLYCINTLKLSENMIHSRMNAIKFYYEQVLIMISFLWKFHDLKNQVFCLKHSLLTT